jgi:hypothetical protein
MAISSFAPHPEIWFKLHHCFFGLFEWNPVLQSYNPFHTFYIILSNQLINSATL